MLVDYAFLVPGSVPVSAAPNRHECSLVRLGGFGLSSSAGGRAGMAPAQLRLCFYDC
jgi:hypothetical protein